MLLFYFKKCLTHFLIGLPETEKKKESANAIAQIDSAMQCNAMYCNIGKMYIF